MGQEISAGRFRKHDFERFAQHLRKETALLGRWFREGSLSREHAWGGFELEAWLIDDAAQPAPLNDAFLAAMDDALVSPELSRFNVELNSTPRQIRGNALVLMQRELERNWARCRTVARTLGADLLMIGILPTVRDEMLTLANMSQMQRYRALNEQVLRQRQGRPIRLDIEGTEHLRTEHCDVMLEAATTSFQIHLQVTWDKAVRYFNAAQILSAPMVAVSANSPLLFGKRLWQETRIPLFEQAVAVGGIDGAAFGPVKRVTFGSGYARRSLFELFEENLEHYPLLLPVNMDEPPERLAHLRLHNGTIWRWNRPLVGFDVDGTPHLRIEHRVIPAGPDIEDALANAAFFFGLMHTLAEAPTAPERQLDFARTKDNFYTAAKHGLAAHITWLDGHVGSVAELILQRLLREARQGLEHLGCDGADIRHYLGIIEERVQSGRTGAQWQLDYLDAQGHAAFERLVQAYQRFQESGSPVHQWPV